MKKQLFKDRVARLREAQNLTQSELAERADLTPASLSRLLSGDRELRMEHILQIARALNTTAPELIGGTDAESVLLEWVSRDQYEKAERDRQEASNLLAALRSEAKAREAEVEAIRRTVDLQAKRIDHLERDAAARDAALRVAEAERTELVRIRGELANQRTECERLRALSGQLRTELTGAQAERDLYVSAYNDAFGRAAVVQKQLNDEKQAGAGRTALAALLGSVFGATVLASSGTSGRSRRG